MITIRKGTDRGNIKLPWLNAKHSFSFGSYFDPKWMGFGPLRVINEDIISEGQGFDTHSHKDMEIISYIVAGGLEHKDTLGNNSVIRPGQIQIMSAGTGIFHSEFNPDQNTKTHSLQIWIEPNKLGVNPRYEQYDVELKENELSLIVSPNGGDKIAMIYQEANLYHGYLKSFSRVLDPKKFYWVQIYEGDGKINEQKVVAGDGVAFKEEVEFRVISKAGMKLLFFELV